MFDYAGIGTDSLASTATNITPAMASAYTYRSLIYHPGSGEDTDLVSTTHTSHVHSHVRVHTRLVHANTFSLIHVHDITYVHVHMAVMLDQGHIQDFFPRGNLTDD